MVNVLGDQRPTADDGPTAADAGYTKRRGPPKADRATTLVSATRCSVRRGSFAG
jgi:hypothetical protein